MLNELTKIRIAALSLILMLSIAIMELTHIPRGYWVPLLFFINAPLAFTITPLSQVFLGYVGGLLIATPVWLIAYYNYQSIYILGLILGWFLAFFSSRDFLYFKVALQAAVILMFDLNFPNLNGYFEIDRIFAICIVVALVALLQYGMIFFYKQKLETAIYDEIKNLTEETAALIDNLLAKAANVQLSSFESEVFYKKIHDIYASFENLKKQYGAEQKTIDKLDADMQSLEAIMYYLSFLTKPSLQSNKKHDALLKISNCLVQIKNIAKMD